jgi:hypothetical protein
MNKMLSTTTLSVELQFVFLLFRQRDECEPGCEQQLVGTTDIPAIAASDFDNVDRIISIQPLLVSILF